jgi:hypothetical protein
MGQRVRALEGSCMGVRDTVQRMPPWVFLPLAWAGLRARRISVSASHTKRQATLFSSEVLTSRIPGRLRGSDPPWPLGDARDPLRDQLAFDGARMASLERVARGLVLRAPHPPHLARSRRGRQARNRHVRTVVVLRPYVLLPEQTVQKAVRRVPLLKFQGEAPIVSLRCWDRNP